MPWGKQHTFFSLKYDKCVQRWSNVYRVYVNVRGMWECLKLILFLYAYHLMSKVNIVNKDDETGVWISKPKKKRNGIEILSLLFYLPEGKYV